ncbi:crotonobetainyl-CoA hydratase/dehydration protein DpgD [Noviherbaspirillum humi]|uniref:Crotonobetainyl-CoA hydratase/dehydration protein DpgD n=1 Tax=Noviherbaspirillum humi TaxID=1688639 RepID=A0A239LXM8_9BURK|nr:enoyl-CoA hydratase-related protein [Noviherbaspirillum humi]SNT34394.1 crotonobetainyl-CoA hydratase/dehydration protein DpgD [Noviherbaspirillum humi]
MEAVLYEKRGHVGWLAINRPQAMNAMDSHAHLALSQALDAIQSDDEVRVVVLTGSGERAFSAGRDLKEVAAEASMSPAEKEALAQRWKQARRLTDRHDFFKPIIARVNGLAYGGGFELALACDVIVAAEHAGFALPEPKRGLIAMAGGVHRLPRQLPQKVAMGLMLTGRVLPAARAYELGLVNQVVPPAELDAAVDAWVADMLECAPLSLQSTKQCALLGLGQPLEQAMMAVYPLEEKRKASADTIEGPKAFAEKRKPQWTGR